MVIALKKLIENSRFFLEAKVIIRSTKMKEIDHEKIIGKHIFCSILFAL
jgi:hypothetical protein